MRSLKPDFSLSLGLGILRFFSCFGGLQVGSCVGVLRQLSCWQGIRTKILYKTLIAYLAFVNEFILIGRWWQTPSLRRITWREIHNSFLTLYLPIVSGYTDLLLFTMYVAPDLHIIAHDVVNGLYPKVLVKGWDNEMRSCASVFLKGGFH